MTPTLNHVCAFLVLGLVASFASPQTAGASDAFLKGLEGSWRGRGAATLPGRQAEERISCRLTITWQAAASSLKVVGECASTQAKVPVNGRLTLNGKNVSGSLINAFEGATVTKSVGTTSETGLEVSSNYVDNATGTLTRTRQVVRKNGDGFSAEFFTFDTKSGTFKPAGSLAFSAK
jgi:hypothetical protein